MTQTSTPLNRLMAVTVLTTLLLSGCGGTDDTKPDVTQALAVLEAVGWASKLSEADTLSFQASRPTALLGTVTSSYLAERATVLVESAMLGVKVHDWMQHQGSPVSPDADDNYALLEQLDGAINLDLLDVLNRSPDRAVALDRYTADLADILEQGASAQAELTTEIESLTTHRKAVQSNISGLSKSQKQAVSENKFQLAGDLQVQLDREQTDLDQTESDLQRAKDAEKLFDELLKVGVERQAAIEANREVLVTGVKVIDLPRARDLGILQGNGKSSRSGFTFGD